MRSRRFEFLGGEAAGSTCFSFSSCGSTFAAFDFDRLAFESARAETEAFGCDGMCDAADDAASGLGAAALGAVCEYGHAAPRLQDPFRAKSKQPGGM